MQRLLFLCMIFLQLHAADDGSDLMPATPDQFIQLLEEREQKSSEVYQDESFVLGGFYKTSIIWEGFPLKNRMKECGVGPYDTYLVRLASSTALSPEEKLDESLVAIPPFKQLSDDKKQAVLTTCLEQLGDNEFYPLKRLYPITRIVVASLLSNKEVITSQQGSQLLWEAVIHDDIFMIGRLLHLKVDPNTKYHGIFCPLANCKSSEAARLMIDRGAHRKPLGAVLSTNFPSHLREHKDEKSKEFLDYLICNVPLNESNGLGLSYMKQIANMGTSRVNVEQLSIYLTILLQQNFACDSDTKNKICELSASKSEDAHKEVKLIFANHEEPGKNIKGAE